MLISLDLDVDVKWKNCQVLSPQTRTGPKGEDARILLCLFPVSNWRREHRWNVPLILDPGIQLLLYLADDISQELSYSPAQRVPLVSWVFLNSDGLQSS